MTITYSDFNTLTKGRKKYIEKRASKAGLSVADYLKAQSDKAETVVIDATKQHDNDLEDFIAKTDELVELDVNIVNVFKTKMGMTNSWRTDFPIKNTEANIKLSIDDHKQHGYNGTDQQVLMSAWGVITGQCMAGAHEKGKKFFMGQQFSMWLSQSVSWFLKQMPSTIKTIKIHLYGTKNMMGVGGDPWMVGWSPDSKIELLDKSGKIIDRVTYKSLRQGKSDAEVLKHNADQLSKMSERVEA
jgi:hypothetical protein